VFVKARDNQHRTTARREALENGIQKEERKKRANVVNCKYKKNNN